MKKIFKKSVSLFMCMLMVFSCCNFLVFDLIGIIQAAAADIIIAGDINGDGKLNNKDLTRLMKYIADNETTVVKNTVDVNGDGAVTAKDLTRLLKYLSGADVVVSVTGCAHNKTEFKAKEPTCETEGNIAYWFCETCNRYSKDEEGTEAITLDETILDTVAHTEETIPGYPASLTQTGLTDGIKCSVCDKVLMEQVVIPISEYEIVYEITDKYIQNLYLNGKLINDNPKTYASNTGVLSFNNITATDGQAIPGYTFLGWYDAPQESPDAVRVKKIPAGETGKITLYAHWSKVAQKVYFKSDLTQPTSTTMEYYIDEGSAQFEVLKAPDTYIFVGWSDENGAIHDRVPAGTEGPVTYTANWISNRNQAWAKKDIGEPIVYEDENVILYTYEIGLIRNVPLYTMVDFGYINADGVTRTKESTYSTTVSTELMKSYTSTIAKATTESFGWTLSSGWEESISLNEEWLEENEVSVETAKEICKNESNEYYVSSGASGYDTTVTVDETDTYDLKTTTENTKTYNIKDKETRQDFSVGLNANYTTGASLNLKVPVEGAEVGVGAEKKLSLGADLKYSNGVTTNVKTGTEKDEGSTEQDGTITHEGITTTNNTSWNMESGSRSSSSVAQTDSVRKAVTSLVSNKTNYGKEYINTGDETETQGFSATSENTDEYSSVVTYNKTEGTEIKETFTTEGTVTGYHRLVMASDAHVFAIVGYDIKTQSYFVNNFTIMDDYKYSYEDYSMTSGEYDDHQNSYIPFSVPVDIIDHVANRTHASDGLQINKSGYITGYEGDDTFVVIPEYHVQTNPKDGSKTVTKIVGITADAFKSKKDEITAVVLSDYITTIPDYCFEGCSKLLSVDGKGITTIGNYAFKDCNELKVCTLNDNVTSLGTGSFTNVDYLEVKAANKSVAEMALKSGAKEIIITVSDKCTDIENVELTVPDSVENFTFNGNGMKFNNVSIVSDAKTETIINRAEFVSTGKTPLNISSPKITLLEVTVTAPSICFISSAPEAEIALYGESYIGDSDKDAMLCKNVTLSVVDSKWFSKLYVSGNILLCGEIENKNTLLSVENGKIISIDETEFEKYKTGTLNVTFDVNEGYFNDATTVKTVYFGQTYGILPVPSRDYYTFAGWYTAKEGGTEIGINTEVETFGEQTLYAHWIENDISDWVLAESDEIPEGAEIVDTMWTYTLTEYKEHTDYSDTSNLESLGWTKYNTVRTGWGPESGPLNYDPSNGVRNVRPENYIASYTTHYVYYHRYKNGSWSDDAHAQSWARHQGPDVTYQLPNGYLSPYTGQRYTGDACSSCGATNQWHLDYTYDSPNYATRWYYQEPIYTYYYSKQTDNIPAESDPTGQTNVSNVVKWVQYRAK